MTQNEPCVPECSADFCGLPLLTKQYLHSPSMDMSFYSNASDNMAVVMDFGDLEVIYGAASEAGYQKFMEVMEGLGEAI